MLLPRAIDETSARRPVRDGMAAEIVALHVQPSKIVALIQIQPTLY